MSLFIGHGLTTPVHVGQVSWTRKGLEALDRHEGEGAAAAAARRRRDGEGDGSDMDPDLERDQQQHEDREQQQEEQQGGGGDGGGSGGGGGSRGTVGDTKAAGEAGKEDGDGDGNGKRGEEQGEGREEEEGEARAWAEAAALRLLRCSCVVAMHPDQATEAAARLAMRLGKPFALVPCCVYAGEFPGRRLASGEEVRGGGRRRGRGRQPTVKGRVPGELKEWNGGGAEERASGSPLSHQAGRFQFS